MQCPLCHDHPLEPRFSHGIEIDVCPNCKGIWLDRGELERLIGANAPTAPPAPANPTPAAPPRPHDRVSQQRARSDSSRADSKSPESRKSDAKKSKKKHKSWGNLLEQVLDEVLDL